MMSITLMGTADTYFVGTLGTAQQGAVGFTTTLMWSVFCFFIGTLEIVQTYVAQATGAGSPERAARWGSSGLHLALAFSVVPLPLALAGESLFAALGVAPAMIPFAGTYFRIRILGAAPIFLSRIGDGYYRGLGDTVTPMIVAGIANVLNVILDALWIPGVPALGIPSFGVEGAAWATIVATCVHTAIYLGLARRRRARGGPAPRYRDRLAPADQRELLRVGAPSGLHWAVDIAAWTLFTVAVARLDETQAAANVIGLTIIRASFMPGFGFSTAAQTLVGQYLGARDVASARRSGWNSTWITLGYMGGMGLLFLLFRETLVGFFTDDPEVIRVGSRLLLWGAAFQIGDGLQLVIAGALRGAGDTRFVMWTALAGSWAVFAPLTFWLMIVRGMGAEAGWLAVNVWVAALVVPLIVRFRGDAWTKGGINLEPRPVPEAEVA
jgi:MATE family multidrug resistance protein